MQFILFEGVIIAEYFFLPRNFRILRFFIDVFFVFRLPEIPDREHEQAVFFEDALHFFERLQLKFFCRKVMEHGDAPDRIKRVRRKGEFCDFGIFKNGIWIFLFRDAQHGAIVVYASIVDGFVFEKM